MKKFSMKLVGQSLKDAFKGFSDDKVTKLSASLAYYTVFSLAPLLIVIISLAGFFLGAEAVEGTIDEQISGFIGADAAKQIQDMIRNAALSDKGTLSTIIGIVTLIIGATSVFGEIQDSINSIWGLKPKPKVGIMKTLKTRLLSFGIIGSLAFLLLVSLAATAFISAMGKQLQSFFPNVSVALFYVINLVITLTVITALFAVIFKVLPDAKIKLKDILPGAIATALLFMVGKFAISLYISKSDIGSSFGAAGSLVVLLVWIYYSSIILYFGAEFTKAYAFNKGATIIPNKYAEWSDKPAVAGSRPKETGGASERRRQEPKAKAPQLAVSYERTPGKKQKASGPGMGTVLLGLALYMFNTSKKTSE